MPRRWSILLILFLARTTMAFQFQAVAALAPLLMNSYGVGLADIGILVGVYLAPGIAIALPGGAIAARFGERRTVVAAMAGMVAGGVAMTLAPSWELQLVGRALAGAGGVVLNVVMAKMVTDWFAGREIATAMGIYVNSWPVGIAAALVILPALAGGGSRSRLAR
jgi:MFS family permease